MEAVKCNGDLRIGSTVAQRVGNMHHKKYFSSIDKLVIASTLYVAVLVLNGYSQSSVTINVNDAADVVPKELFGVLMERLGRQWNGNGGIFVGTGSSIPNTDGMRNDVIDGFKECGVGSIEWPGGVCSE